MANMADIVAGIRDQDTAEDIARLMSSGRAHTEKTPTLREAEAGDLVFDVADRIVRRVESATSRQIVTEDGRRWSAVTGLLAGDRTRSILPLSAEQSRRFVHWSRLARVRRILRQTLEEMDQVQPFDDVAEVAIEFTGKLDRARDLLETIG